MLRSTTLFCLFLFTISAIGQKKSDLWGKIPGDQLYMDSYELDADAEAVILHDEGHTAFVIDQGSISITMNRITRIKVLKEGGKQWGDVIVPRYNDGFGRREYVKDIEAISYNLVDGKVERSVMDKKAVYDENVNELWNQTKFAIPNVRVGSVIEYRYTFTTPFVFNLPDWEFQNTIPTVLSKYTIALIPFYVYQLRAQGITKFDDYRKYDMTGVPRRLAGIDFKDTFYEYTMRDVEAFTDESYISSKNDYIKKLDVQLSHVKFPGEAERQIMNTWPGLAKEFNTSPAFGKVIKQAKNQWDKTHKPALGILENKAYAKAKAIVEFVKDYYQWNGKYRTTTEERVKSIIENRSGSSAEINLLLTGFLQAENIKAKPVILSTRNHGKVYPKYPFATAFNYVIVLVETDIGDFLVDGAAADLAWNRIPLRCINDQGFVINDAEGMWVDLMMNTPSEKRVIFKTKSQDRKFETNVTMVAAEYAAHEWRSENLSSTDAENWYAENGLGELDTVIIKNKSTVEKPLVVSAVGTPNYEVIDDLLLIKPFLNFPLSSNPFKKVSWQYDVDLVYPRANNFKSYVTIPEGYELESLPESISVSDELVDIVLDFRVSKSEVTVEGKYVLKQSIYPPDYYKRLKNHISTIVDKFNEALVFVKK